MEIMLKTQIIEQFEYFASQAMFLFIRPLCVPSAAPPTDWFRQTGSIIPLLPSAAPLVRQHRRHIRAAQGTWEEGRQERWERRERNRGERQERETRERDRGEWRGTGEREEREEREARETG